LGIWFGRTASPRRQPWLLRDLIVAQSARFYLA
jgi:hypothetical protein